MICGQNRYISRHPAHVAPHPAYVSRQKGEAGSGTRADITGTWACWRRKSCWSDRAGVMLPWHLRMLPFGMGVLGAGNGFSVVGKGR